MKEIQEIKQYLLQMDEKDLLLLLKLAGEGAQRSGKPAQAPAGPEAPWYERNFGGLDRPCLARLREEKQRLKNGSRGSGVDQKWIRYANAFRKMQFCAPELFRSSITPKQMYTRLAGFCREQDIPEEIAWALIPSLIEYIRTGHMRPVILCGEKGCGKTTAFRLLIREALGIPVALIKVPEEDAGHGLTGTCGSYTSADLGSLGRAMIRENSPVLGFLFDEIDKASHNPSRAGIEDELLSITDESVSTVVDKYLESTLRSLPYCPIFFTCNDLKKVSPILADRCTLIQFPRAAPERIKSIMKKYVCSQLNKELYRMVEFDFALLDSSIDHLLSSNIHSLRKHQQLVESVLKNAFRQAMVQPEDCSVQVTPEMFRDAEQQILGSETRRVGFMA